MESHELLNVTLSLIWNRDDGLWWASRFLIKADAVSVTMENNKHHADLLYRTFISTDVTCKKMKIDHLIIMPLFWCDAL